jgi:Flagellar L-ring protein
MVRAMQQLLAMACLVIGTQVPLQHADADETPRFKIGDVVTVIFIDGERIPAAVTAIDAKGLLTINANRDTYLNGLYMHRSISGIIRASDIKPDKLIPSNEVESLKVTRFAAHTRKSIEQR